MTEHIFYCDIFPADATHVERKADECCAAYFGDMPYEIISIDTTAELAWHGDLMSYRTSIVAKATP